MSFQKVEFLSEVRALEIHLCGIPEYCGRDPETLQRRAGKVQDDNNWEIEINFFIL